MCESADRRLQTLLGTLLTALSDSLTACGEQLCGHTGASAGALTYLVQEPGLGIDQLKGPLGLSQSATVRLVDRLATDGLVQRRPGRDARSVAIHLTPSGDEVARSILLRRAEMLSAALAPLDGPERERLTALIEKVLGHLTVDWLHGQRICRFCDVPSCPQDTCPVTTAAGPRPGPPRELDS